MVPIPGSDETGFSSYFGFHRLSHSFTHIPSYRNNGLSAIPPSIQKVPLEKFLDNRMLSFSKKDAFRKFSRKQSRNTKILCCDATLFKTQHCISLIKDPLWKRICSEIIEIMAPHLVLKICDSQLGPVAPGEREVDLYCQKEEIVQLIEPYAFIILTALKPYFPALKEVRITYKSL